MGIGKNTPCRGRMSSQENDIFYTCGLIAFIARLSKNHPHYIAQKLGHENIAEINNLADVLHSENIEAVADRYIHDTNITNGNFDNIAECQFTTPSHWDIAKVYKRLVMQIINYEKCTEAKAIAKAYESPVCMLIEDYNSSFYYENPGCIFETYLNNGMPIQED